jgi:hypothetical protein
MSRRQKDPLRPPTEEERRFLERLSRSQSQPAAHVARAKAVLAVAEGHSYTEAAKMAGYCVGDTVAKKVEPLQCGRAQCAGARTRRRDP